ncbi:MAG: hypothetical protein LUQ59_11780 [Methanothrix sp.]|nr:hypothetical protein [Methanothrix sp.]
MKNCDILFVTTCLSSTRATGSKLWAHVAGSGQITFLRRGGRIRMENFYVMGLLERGKRRQSA